jgi:hypothetical protein
MKRLLKIILITLVVGFIVIQFINRPDKTVLAETSPDDITKHMQVPEKVHGILKRSCYDCHSRHTKWPWYSHIAPASWLVGDDVSNGRKKMNFSEWGRISDDKKEARLNEICELITEGEMPLPNYLLLHSEAKLSQEDKDILCRWAEEEVKKLEEKDSE